MTGNACNKIRSIQRVEGFFNRLERLEDAFTGLLVCCIWYAFQVHSLMATSIWAHVVGFSLVHVGSSLERDHFCQEQEAIHRKGNISCRQNRTR